MRVALIDPSLFTLPYDTALADGLRAAGHEVTFYGRPLAPDEQMRGGGGVIPAFYRHLGTKSAVALPRPAFLAAKGLSHVCGAIALARRLTRDPPEVVHFQWLPLPVVDRGLVAALRRVAPVVFTMHDSNPFNAAPSSRLQRIGAFSALDAVDRVIVHTAQARARLEARGLSAERIAQVAHGLLGDEAPAAAGAPPASDERDAEPCFLLFGKIKPYKGVDTLIRAFAALPPGLRMRARIRIVGKPYMDIAPLERLARESGVADRVAFELGFVADDVVPALFGPGSIPVFPYREIDSSGVLALAIRYGRPVIASRIGGFAETLEDERHGLLVPPGDDAALTAAMARMITESALRTAAARAMAMLAVATPTWRAIGERTAEVYAAARAAWAAARRAV